MKFFLIIVTAISFSAMLMSLSECGQTGHLYLPKAKTIQHSSLKKEHNENEKNS